MTAISQLENAEAHVAAVVLAFDSDPFVRWLFPTPARYLEAFTARTHAHARATAAHGGAWGTDDGRAAAFWYPPGTAPEGSPPGPGPEDPSAAARASAVFAEMAAYEPTGPHWYLRQIGVDPALRGQGVGAALLDAGVAQADRDGLPAYLEATSAAAAALYARHGFAVLAEVSVDGSPPLWPMARAAR